MAYALIQPTSSHRIEVSRDLSINSETVETFDVVTIDLVTGDFKNKRIEVPVNEEKILDSIEFDVFKFNERIRPDNNKRILIISCFSEFGCETIGCMYSLPKIIKYYPGRYVIAMGWHGREYLYRHLVDEFWEIKEEYMWLRDYTRAFHHVSYNLSKIEYSAARHGSVVPSITLGRWMVGNTCKTCGQHWAEWRKYEEECPSCKSTLITRSLFGDVIRNKPEVVKIPKPSFEMDKWASSLVKPNTVGIFARDRKTYGRNLGKKFYIKLINLVKSMGYNIIWLGEKQSTLACPVDGIIDFSRMPESRELEKTLAIVSKLEFTIQFWTASTRLSGITDTPFLLFESPDQIYCSGGDPAQEGIRLELASFGDKKLCISEYENCNKDHKGTLELVERCILEMKDGNHEDVIGLVDDKKATEILQTSHYEIRNLQ